MRMTMVISIRVKPLVDFLRLIFIILFVLYFLTAPPANVCTDWVILIFNLASFCVLASFFC